MKLRLVTCLVAALTLPVVLTASARADEAADRKAEIQRKKDDAKKRAAEKTAAAASAKTAADSAAADAKKAADAKAAADKAAADAKAAAEKAAADKKAATGAGGTTSTGAGGATATATGGTTSTGGTGSGGAKATSATGGAGGATSTALPTADIEALRKDRVDRRKVTVEGLRKRWGSLLANPSGAADLKNHSRRVAFLQRARLVAQSKKDTKSLAVADQLLTEEDERHSNAMNALREGALGGGTTK